MNRALIDDSAFNDWVKKRAPAGRWGRPDELIGTAVSLAGIVTLAREERERTIRGADFHAAATTSRHVVIVAARSTRCD
jgi:chitodextrinase